MAQARGKWLSSDPVGRAVASDAVGRRGPTQVAGQGVAKVTQSGAVTLQPHRVGETHIVLLRRHKTLDRTVAAGELIFCALLLVTVLETCVGEGNSQPSSLNKFIFVGL